MRISRPCYDKPHRCPGWAGGGALGAKVYRCESGSLGDGMYDKKAWAFRFNRCKLCNLMVWPYVISRFDWRWWGWKFRDLHRWFGDFIRGLT